MPRPILSLTKKYMKAPKNVTISKEELTVPLIDQYYFETKDKIEGLCRLLDAEIDGKLIIFCRTKKGVDDLAIALGSRGYMAEGLHGDLSQTQRDRVMKKFRDGTADILIATDVAARGIDIDNITHVINFDIPQDPESYVHRIGRTGRVREMSPDEFSGILTVGGTILGTKRTPFKKMRVVEEDKVDKVAAMKKNYRAAKLDCLLCLGGNGTHKTANLLSQEGLNIIGLPKTIDNDIYGTDVTFGFHTAVDIATEVIDRIHTTAGSHSRVMCIEIMGNKAGWLTLYSGIAGGADIILLPELPYDIKKVAAAVENRAKAGKNFSILAVAEGAFSTEEAKMKRKEWTAKRAEAGYTTATARIAKQIEEMTGAETRICVPGHMQRGGSPSAYDRVLATQFGSYAAGLVADEHYGVTVAMVNRHVTANPLADIAGKTRGVPGDCDMLNVARAMGISLG